MIRFRPDIEGLRAVAVLLVIFNHLDVRGFHGGFTGVDVFFVISGYLITSLLAAEYADKAASRHGYGSIAIGGFYLRRARRILPAALTVIAAVLVASHYLLNVLRTQQVRHDALWTTFFAANINFIRQSTDYFAAGLASSSPYRHYWSLSVEEQFYFVWPALFLIVVGLHGRRIGQWKIGWRVRLGVTLGLIGVASVIWSVADTASNPASAYFSTFTRAWELALGALVGITTSRATTIGYRPATAASIAGVGLLLAGCLVINGGSPFPGYLALLPTFGAALLIVGGLSDRPPAANKVISVAPMRFLGRISYSLYLWHWPLIVFAAALYPRASTETATRAAIFALTVVVATVSYYAVERPFRRMSFAGGSYWLDEPLNRLKRRTIGPLKTAGAIAALAAFAVGLGIAVTQIGAEAGTRSSYSSDHVAIQLSKPKPTPKTSTTRRRRSQPPETILGQWQSEVRAAVAITSVPQSLQPLSKNLANIPVPCESYRLAIVEHEHECTWGSQRPQHVAAITGDSHAGMWLTTLEDALDRRTWSLHPFTRSWCGWSGDSENIAAATKPLNKDCPALQAQTVTELRKIHPDLLILSENGVHTSSQMEDALARYARVAKTVVVLGHTPVLPNFADCLRGATDISSCRGTLSTGDFDSVAFEQHMAQIFGDPFIDTPPWFCFNVTCPPIIDNAPAFADGAHLSTEMAPKLAPILRASLRESGALP